LLFAIFVPVPEGLAQLFVSGRKAWLLDAAMGALFPALILWATGAVWGRLRKKEVLGLGDVKLIAMVGSFLGLRGTFLTMAAGSVAGSIIGLGYILVSRKDWQSYELPFGTFLGFAALAVAVFAGQGG
jgi:leader peptidase (prepilin peptidase) / N-methyltransferase